MSEQELRLQYCGWGLRGGCQSIPLQLLADWRNWRGRRVLWV